MAGRGIFAKIGKASTARAAEEEGPAVLQVLPAMEAGGVERSAVDFAATVTESRGRAFVVSEGGQMERHLQRAGARHIAMPLATRNPARVRGNIDHLSHIIRSNGVDILHLRSRGPAKIAQAAARRTGCRLVTDFGAASMAGNLLQRARSRILTTGDRVSVVSEFLARHLITTFNVDPARIRVVPRGVDLDVFCPDQVSPQRVIRLATEWRLRDGMPLIMMPPRFTAWKGQAFFFDALAALKEMEFACVVIATERGRTSNRDELEQMVRRRGLEDRVFVLDHCNDMAAAYMLADTVVCPGPRPEAFGRTIGEAQAMGRPVVASDHGGVREQVLADETGFLYPPGDVQALATALRRTIGLSAEHRRHIGRQAETHARSRFAKDRVGELVLDLYRELLEESGRAGFGAGHDRDFGAAQ